MIEEKQYIFSLVDTYEDLLTERQKEMLHDYYYNDFSLNEIAESLAITKQAVKDSIDKAIKNLNRYEDALHLVDKQQRLSGRTTVDDQSILSGRIAVVISLNQSLIKSPPL